MTSACRCSKATASPRPRRWSASRIRAKPAIAGSVGKPLSKLEVKLDGDGDVGELLVRGPNVMEGYYRNQAATDEVLKDGWLHTGDLGRFDTEGRLYIVGRAKDVIVDAGGNNIYIDEVEEIYGHNSDIKEMAVVGMKLGGGEQPAALVVPAYGRGTSRRTLEDRLRAHFDKISAGLSPHKRVRILRFTDHELPRTRTRKVKRNEVVDILRQMLQARTEEQVAASAEVEKWLAHAIAQVSNEVARITPATRLIEDLGLDSLALAELAEHIGEHLGRDIGDRGAGRSSHRRRFAEARGQRQRIAAHADALLCESSRSPTPRFFRVR